MLLNIAIAAFMMVATTGIHAGGMILAMHAFRPEEVRWKQRLHRTRIYRVVVTVLLMFLVSLAEALAWAIPYLAFDAIQGFEKAVYFSMVTFTTLGYGDVLLDEHWRLLASFEAANGIIMFGWTTAIVMAAIRHVYFSKEPERHD